MSVSQIFVSSISAHGFGSKKFRVKLAQASKIGFKFFSLGFGRQAVSFGKVCFFWLALFLVKSGFQNWLQVFWQKFRYVWFRFFRQVHFFWQSRFWVKSVFSKGFGKFSTLRFGQSVLISKDKSGLKIIVARVKSSQLRAWFCF